MIVDDQAGFRDAARAVLHARGHTVIAQAADGTTALEAAARVGPDAVLLDVRLADESGLDVARALIAAQPQLAVLLVSGDDTAISAQLLSESGACGFLPKRRLATADLAALWQLG